MRAATILRTTACKVKSPRLLRVSLIALSILGVEICDAEPERSLSPSGQFVIYGGDVAWRGAIATLAEQTKANLLALLQRRDQWTIPAVINLQPRVANLPEIPNSALRVSQTGAGLKLQLDLTISREMNPSSVEREIMRVILLEMIYRKETSIASGESYVPPPDWLVDGLLAAAPNHDRASVTNTLIASNEIMPLETFLNQRLDTLDLVGRSFYRAYSFGIVQLLAENPSRVGSYIDNLAFSSNDPMADLRKSFPELASSDFEKIWKSKIAGIQDSAQRNILNFSQSDERLGELLQTKFSAAGGRGALSLEDVGRNKLNFDQRAFLKKFSQELMLFATVANPALRPIVQEYQQLAEELALGRNHGVASRLASLKALRTKLSARMSEVDDYMNWFEATQLKTSSGMFDNAKTGTAIPRLKRRDNFSVYLDAMESQF